MTNTRPLTSARSTRRSPPSTNASRAPTTSSRSTPEVEREVVARARRDARVGQAELGGDRGDDRLRAVAPGHREAVGAASDGVADERLEVVAAAELDRLDVRARAPRRRGGSARPCRLPTSGCRRARVASGRARPAATRGPTNAARAAPSDRSAPTSTTRSSTSRPCVATSAIAPARASAATVEPRQRAPGPRRTSPYHAAAATTRRHRTTHTPCGKSSIATTMAKRDRGHSERRWPRSPPAWRRLMRFSTP